MSKNVTFITKNPSAYDYAEMTMPVKSGLGLVHDYCNSIQYVDFDTETNTLNPYKGGVLLAVLGDENQQFVIDTTRENGYTLKEIIDGIEWDNKTMRGANLKFDLKFLAKEGTKLPNKIWDVMVIDQSITKGSGLSCSLDAIAQRYLGVPPLKKAVRNEFPLMNTKRSYFYNRHIYYAAEDCEHLSLVMEKQKAVLEKFHMVKLGNLNNQVTLIMAKAETRGVLLDVERWKENAIKYQVVLKDMQSQMDAHLRVHGIKSKERRTEVVVQGDLWDQDKEVTNKNLDHINYNSNKQLTEAFQLLGWDLPMDNKGKVSFASEILSEYTVMYHGLPQAKFMGLLKDYKDANKRVNSFGFSFLSHVEETTGAVHPEFGVNRTETGRFSCSSPNLQNIPNTLDFRHCFIAREGYKMLTADFSSAELRILADFSGDSIMMDILDNEGDLHGFVAEHVFRAIGDDPNIVVDKNNNKHLRNQIKAVIFSKLYGSGLQKTAELLKCPITDAIIAESAMREALPDAFTFLDVVSLKAVEDGFIEFNTTMRGRRWFPECFFTSPDGRRHRTNLKEFQEASVIRKAKNSPMQGTNADITKVAIANIDHEIRKHGWDVHLLLSVHDEVVYEISESEDVEAISLRIVDIMNKSANKFFSLAKMKADYDIEDYWTK